MAEGGGVGEGAGAGGASIDLAPAPVPLSGLAEHGLHQDLGSRWRSRGPWGRTPPWGRGPPGPATRGRSLLRWMQVRAFVCYAGNTLRLASIRPCHEQVCAVRSDKQTPSLACWPYLSDYLWPQHQQAVMPTHDSLLSIEIAAKFLHIPLPPVGWAVLLGLCAGAGGLVILLTVLLCR